MTFQDGSHRDAEGKFRSRDGFIIPTNHGIADTNQPNEPGDDQFGTINDAGDIERRPRRGGRAQK